MVEKKLWRGATAGLAAVALAGSMVACSGTPGDEGSKGEVSLRAIVYTSNPDQINLLNSIADEFVAQDPEVTSVTFESTTAGDLDKKLTAELPSSDPPDLSWMTVANSTRYIDAGALLNLEPTLKSTEGYDFDDLISSLQENWQKGDGLYGVPFSTSTQVLYYNADLFEAAGIPNPNEMMEAGTWDWEHFAQAAKALSESQGVPGYGVTYKNFETMYPLMYAFDASPWSADATTCTMDSPEMTQAMTLLHDMIYKDKSATLPGQTADVFGEQAGASIAYLSSANLLKDATFNWGAVPTPAGPTGPKPTVGQSAFVAFQASKHPEAAARFVAFITNKANSAKLAQFWVPSRDSLLTPEKMHESSPLFTEEQFKQIIDGTKANGTVVPVSNVGGAAQSVLASAMDEYLFQPEADVPTALKDICSELTPALAKN